MNSIKVILVLFCFLGMTLTSVSCNSQKTSTENANQGKEYKSAYVCPMHCKGSGSDNPSNCPVCGMEYEKNEEAADHSH